MQKNIWVAAGDGDLAPPRRRSMQVPLPTISSHRSSLLHPALHPNVPDPFSYTPLHAAASYGHIDVLAFLLSRGGDVNITDDDGDTPLFTVENIETARFLVDHGAHIHHRNHEGISPIEHLSQDFPAVATYLQSLLVASPSPHPPAAPEPPSQHAQNAQAEHLTDSLMHTVADIMRRAEAEGRDPDAELRAAVSRTVAEGVVAGYHLTSPPPSDSPAKRPRTDDAP
ncbi:hypothetical protein H0H87_009612 [Tephrocybe sp. NHM501043]|nr:hypothetical protein H0H87_009612 [Tephrocybe sp. NHM501043]